MPSPFRMMTDSANNAIAISDDDSNQERAPLQDVTNNQMISPSPPLYQFPSTSPPLPQPPVPLAHQPPLPPTHQPTLPFPHISRPSLPHISLPPLPHIILPSLPHISLPSFSHISPSALPSLYNNLPTLLHISCLTLPLPCIHFLHTHCPAPPSFPTILTL